MAGLPQTLMNPPLMAIGDSLYNGMRSATIDADKTRNSPPAMIAKALRISKFRVPDLPRPVIVDLEDWLERLSPVIAVPWAIPKILSDLRNSIGFWATGPRGVPSPSSAQAFDNIAFAGATTEDMYRLTAEEADKTARELAAAALAGNDLQSLTANIGTMLIMANARFTLAPDPDTSQANPFRRRTSLEIVAMRQPKRLIVSIGHNDGLIDIVMRAEPAGASHLSEKLRFYYPTLIRELCALPASVEAIYVNLLPAPSAVSNLMPTSTKVIKKPLGQYFESYETLMCYRYGTYTGERLHEIDLEVRDVNQWIMDEFRSVDTKKRVHFVNIFDHMKTIDSKNNGRNAKNTFVVKGRTCTNEMFQANPLGGSVGFKAGGLQGLDGVHLTTAGNALLATWVLEKIAAAEGVSISKPVMKLDPLTRNPPNAWSWALFAYRDIMRESSGKRHNRSSSEEKALQHSVDIAGRVMSQMSLSDGRPPYPMDTDQGATFVQNAKRQTRRKQGRAIAGRNG